VTRRTRRASRTALSRALERMVSLHVSTLGRAGGVSARMVVSHLDVCSELVALAVRCGAGPDADRPVGGRRSPGRGAARGRTGARRGIGEIGFDTEWKCVQACAAARCKLTMHPTHNPWL
jgi:hypothetical protein